MRRTKRFLALFMCILMCLSLLPAEVFAEDGSADFSAAEEIDIDTAEEDDTVPAEEQESAAPTDESTTENSELAESEAEDEHAAETAVFPGMGEGYVLSEEQIALKADLAANEVPSALAELTEGEDYIAGELIAMADTEEEAQQFADAYDADVKEYSYGVVTMALRSATVLEAVTAAADPDVCLPAVEPNYIITMNQVECEQADDVYLESEVPVQESWQSWYENSTNPDPYLSSPAGTSYQWMHDMVNTYEAWGVTTGNTGIKVAIIGCGVDTSNTELNGRVSAVDIGCGTAVAGDEATSCASIIAAAVNNGVGGAGIAPNVSILSVRVQNSNGFVSESDLIKGINAAASNGSDIIDFTYTDYTFSAYVNEAIQNATKDYGALVVAAMGDDGTDIKCYPAAYDNVLAVSAVDKLGNCAYFSNYGAWCDIAAPGVNIMAAIRNNKFKRVSGSAYSSAIVSGVAALYMSKVGGQDSATMTAVLKGATNKCGSSGMGAGIIDASKLFTGDKTAPVITLKDEKGYDVSASAGLSAQGKIYMSFGDGATDTNRIIIYTINGKNPSIADGQITNGYVYSEAISPYQIADVGQTVTIKAAVVSGMGVMGNVTTVKVKILSSAQPTSITILSAGVVEAASGITMKATVEPEYASQEVIWSVVSCSPYQWTIAFDKNGKLTFPQNYSGTVRIRATSAVKSTVYKETTLLVNSSVNSPTSKITLQAANMSKVGTGILSATAVITFADGTTAYSLSKTHTSGVMCEWTSSKTSVAEVDEYGTITAVGAGTVTITCRALDGTNKKASIKIAFKQYVHEITISGQDSIAPGASASFKAAVLPTNAANKNVTWSLIGAPSGVAVDAKSGKVTVPAYVSSGTFTLRATAADGSDVYCSKTIAIRQKTTTLTLSRSDTDYGLNESYKNGSLTAFTLYNIAPVGYVSSYKNDPHTARLQAGTSVSNTAVVWSSDKPGVATVDSTGKVTAVKAGTAKITCAANDGSGKKATCTVTVIVPVSMVSVDPGLSSVDGTYNLGLGKSCTFKATCGDTYGKPTNTKVSWTYRVIEKSGSSSEYDITSYALQNGYVKFSNGKLTTSNKFVNYWRNTDGVYVEVTAETTDGTHISGSATVYLQPCTTYLTPHRIYGFDASKADPYSVYPTVLKGGVISQSSGNSLVMVYTDSYTKKNFVVSSSKPDICGAYIFGYTEDGVVIGLTPGTKTGVSKITVKSCDGSGKSCAFSIKVTA